LYNFIGKFVFRDEKEGESSEGVFSCKFSIKMSWKRDFLTIQGNSGKITDVEGEKYAF